MQTDLIDKATHEIRQDDDRTVYTSLDEVADDLPDHAPRFVLLSYPLTLVCPVPSRARAPRYLLSPSGFTGPCGC